MKGYEGDVTFLTAIQDELADYDKSKELTYKTQLMAIRREAALSILRVCGITPEAFVVDGTGEPGDLEHIVSAFDEPSFRVDGE
jgi:hypothetical protein